MSDGAFPDRLSQLKARWEADPTSRIFIQLAEEYRHQGRIRDALGVLDKGLREHPGYLSALVAKGRCHLELGEAEPARTVLERVVKQDATQMVANKLLVRACLETGDASRARERLELYTLLNDSDPEIEDLRRQIRQMERSSPRPAAEESLFDLGVPKASAPPAEDDIFGLGVGPGPALAAAPPPPAPPEEDAEDATAVGEGDLFPELKSRSQRQRYLAALSSEGIFDLGAGPGPALAPSTAPEEPIPATAAEAPVDVSWLEEQPAPVATPFFDSVEAAAAPPPIPEPFAAAPEPEEPAWALEETTTWAPSPEPVFEPAFESEPPTFVPAPEPPPAFVPAAEPAATATLGDLYLRQGHTEEAERIYRDVLDREPGHAAARAGLDRIEEGRRPAPAPVAVAAPPLPLDAAQLLADYPGGGGGNTARKVHLLNRYLDRLRQGGRRDVS